MFIIFYYLSFIIIVVINNIPLSMEAGVAPRDATITEEAGGTAVATHNSSVREG